MIVTFTPDQQMALLEWLEGFVEAEMSLEEVVQGIRDGSLTTTIVTDSSFPE